MNMNFVGHEGSTNLHVQTPYDGAINDKNLLNNTPQPTCDGDQAPKAVCNQSSSESWNSCAGETNEIPSSVKLPSTVATPTPVELQLQPSVQQLVATWNPSLVEPEASLAEKEVSPATTLRAGPGHLVLCCHAILLAAID
eukprot:3580943-Rhodomonas_salina.1